MAKKSQYQIQQIRHVLAERVEYRTVSVRLLCAMTVQPVHQQRTVLPICAAEVVQPPACHQHSDIALVVQAAIVSVQEAVIIAIPTAVTKTT